MKPLKLVLFFWEPVIELSGVSLIFSFRNRVSMLRVSSGPFTIGLYGGFTLHARKSFQLMFLKKACSIISFASVDALPRRLVGFLSNS